MKKRPDAPLFCILSLSFTVSLTFFGQDQLLDCQPFYKSAMCFFANVERSSSLLESSIGSCQFCGSSSSVDLVQQTSHWFLFGIFPTEPKTERIVSCSQCGKIVKESYYTLRDQQGETELPSAKPEPFKDAREA